MRLVSHFKFLFAIVAAVSSVVAQAGEPPTEPMLRFDLGEHTATVRRFASDAEGHYLVTASDDKTAKVWSLSETDLHSDSHLQNTFRIPIGINNEGKLNAVAISPDSNIVALGGWTQFNNGSKTPSNDGHSIYLFDRASGHLLRRLTGLQNVINSLDFSPDGRTLAVGLVKSGIRLFSIADGRLHAQDQDYGAASYSVQFNTDGTRLVTSCDDGNLRLYSWNGQSLNLLERRSAPGGREPSNARFSPDDTLIAVGFDDTPAVNVLDATNLSFLYAPDTTGVNASLGRVTWTENGLSAAGKAQRKFDYDGEGFIYLRQWQGDTAKDIPVTQNTIVDLLALSNGLLAYSSMGSSWGLLDNQGKGRRRHHPVIADFRAMYENFTLSADGTQVRFGYEYGGKSSVVFDISRRQFLPDDTSNLKPPIFKQPIFALSKLSVTDWDQTTVPKFNGTTLQLEPYERSFSMAMQSDGNGFALGASWTLRVFDRNGSQIWVQLTPAETWAVNVSKDGRWIVAAYGDGTIRWHRASDGVEQLAFFPHADRKRWIIWTPEGYYDASPGAENLIGWHLNQGKDKEARFIPSGQLYDVFFRPDIVQAKFRGEDISSMITITAAQALKMPPPVLSFTRMPSTTKQNMEKVCYKAVATGGGIGEVRLFQNGKLIKSDGFYRESVAKVDRSIKLAAMDSATVTRALKLTKTAQNSEPPMVSNSKGNEYSECQEIETIPGDNEISVAAFNANNTIQSALETTHFTADRKAEAPHLYVLGIGINKYQSSENNLTYAVKDAADFRSMIQDKAKGLFDAANIHIEGLSDAAATKAGIQQAITAISAKVKPWDSFILFVASHGYLQDNQYYIVTSDFDGAIDTTKMISSNEIVGMSKNIKSLSQLLIFDTCHAGGVDNIIGGLYDARMSVMAKKMGLHIYASAGSTQTALDGYQGNGLFTHALLGSMKNNTTDSNYDSEVSVAELGESAKLETMDISKKLGFPQSPNIINFGKDNALFRVK